MRPYRTLSERREKDMRSKSSILGLLVFFAGVAGIIRLIDSLSRRDKKAGVDRDRFDKFTERARKVLGLAQEEAQRLQHNYIGTEHLLLGLVREGEGVAAKVLRNRSEEHTSELQS